MPIFFTSDNTHHLCAMQTDWDGRFTQHHTILTISLSNMPVTDQQLMLILSSQMASLHNAWCSKNSHCSISFALPSSFIVKFYLVNKRRVSKSSACRETTETFKMTTNLFVVQPLYHWHAFFDDYWPLTLANAQDLESHPDRLS